MQEASPPQPNQVLSTVPVLRCLMSLLLDKHLVALLDAHKDCRSVVGMMAWLDIQDSLGHHSSLVWTPPPAETKAVAQWRQLRWVSSYLLHRREAPPVFNVEPRVLRANPEGLVFVEEFGAEYAWALRSIQSASSSCIEKRNDGSTVVRRRANDYRRERRFDPPAVFVETCTSWEVIIDVDMHEGTTECWNGVVGVWRTPNLSNVELPALTRLVHVVTRIGTRALDCVMMHLPHAVTLMDLSGLHLTSLGDNAFFDCHNLTSIEAPGGCNLGTVGGFFACRTPALRYIDASRMHMSSIGRAFLAESGINQVDLMRLRGVTLLSPLFLAESRIELIDLSGLHLSSLGDWAFMNCSMLSSIIAPSGCVLGEVGMSFAAGTLALQHIDIKHIVMTSIGHWFIAESGLASIDLSGLLLRSLGDWAFSECPNLVSIEAPGGCSLGAVGNYFAYRTPSLRRVDIWHMAMTSIGDHFVARSGILRVDLSGLRLSSLGDEAFANCLHLASIGARQGGCHLGSVGRNFARTVKHHAHSCAISERV